MGSLLTPRRLLSRQFTWRCETLGLRPADFIGRATRSLLTPAQRSSEPAEGRRGNLNFISLDLKLKIEQVIALLARDFGVTRRFIEVRLNKYELLAPAIAV